MGASVTDSTAGRCALCIQTHTHVPISSEERGPGLTTETFVQRSELNRENGRWRNSTRVNCLGQTVITVQALCLGWLTATGIMTIQTYETHIQDKDLIVQMSEKSSLISHDMLLSGAVKCLASNLQICLCTITQRAVFF